MSSWFSNRVTIRVPKIDAIRLSTGVFSKACREIRKRLRVGMKKGSDGGSDRVFNECFEEGSILDPVRIAMWLRKGFRCATSIRVLARVLIIVLKKESD